MASRGALSVWYRPIRPFSEWSIRRTLSKSAEIKEVPGLLPTTQISDRQKMPLDMYGSRQHPSPSAFAVGPYMESADPFWDPTDLLPPSMTIPEAADYNPGSVDKTTDSSAPPFEIAYVSDNVQSAKLISSSHAPGEQPSNPFEDQGSARSSGISTGTLDESSTLPASGSFPFIFNSQSASISTPGKYRLSDASSNNMYVESIASEDVSRDSLCTIKFLY